MTISRYSSTDIHKRLAAQWYRGDNYDPPAVGMTAEEEEAGHWVQRDTNDQAEFCPYYVPLTGILGMDWGVIVNPDSPKFGTLVFEHDECRCPEPHPGNWQLKRDPWLNKK